MISPIEDDKTNLIAGRVGELTHEANFITFSLLKKLFDNAGPYQNVLRRFGVAINPTSDSYLELKDNIVYSNLEKENKILWGKYPVKLVANGSQVKQQLIFNSLFDLPKFVNLLNKTIHESLVIININKYVAEARSKYAHVDALSRQALTTKSLSLTDFLKAYEDIVFVTYLYELLDLFNKNSRFDSPTLREYVQENDYLLKDKPGFVEATLKLDKGFYLDDYTNLEEKLRNVEAAANLQFIPAEIKPLSLPNISPQLLAEKELQCLKNNLRLKTNVLLFLLNYSLLNKAKTLGLDKISNLTLDELPLN